MSSTSKTTIYETDKDITGSGSTDTIYGRCWNTQERSVYTYYLNNRLNKMYFIKN